jgi:hypothetical protein
VHPCKIYNILNVAAPVLSIGPRPSHLAEILDTLSNQHPCASPAHGGIDWLVQQVQRLRHEAAVPACQPLPQACSVFSKEALPPKPIAALESG